jgi:prepilin-type N-terminal cleavage/methylation domain-containing protein
MTRAAPRPAFTLLEVLLVVAILLILGAAAYPTLNGMWGDVKVKAAADQVQGAWVEARAAAIEDGRSYKFGVQKETGKFRVAPASSFVEVANLGEDSAPPYVQDGELKSGIKFDLTGKDDLPGEGEWTIVAQFNPDGTCEKDVEITLSDTDPDIPPRVVRVRAMTGAVTQFSRPLEGR